MINIIVACDDDMGIGKEGDIPWYISEDLKRFSSLTTFSSTVAGSRVAKPINHVIMGRVTWESLPSRYRPLPARVNHVISSKEVYGGAEWSSSFEEALNKAKKSGGGIYVIGGQSVYEAALAGEPALLHVTRVQGSHGCDRFFPLIMSEKTLLAKSDIKESAGYKYWFETHEV